MPTKVDATEGGASDCTNCTKAPTEEEMTVRQTSVADLLRTALTQLDRGDVETAQILVRAALGALDPSEPSRS